MQTRKCCLQNLHGQQIKQITHQVSLTGLNNYWVAAKMTERFTKRKTCKSDKQKTLKK